MKKLILIVIIIATLSMACAVNASKEDHGLTFWLSDKAIDQIYNCEDCSELIDWSTVCDCFK